MSTPREQMYMQLLDDLWDAHEEVGRFGEGLLQWRGLREDGVLTSDMEGHLEAIVHAFEHLRESALQRDPNPCGWPACPMEAGRKTP